MHSGVILRGQRDPDSITLLCLRFSPFPFTSDLGLPNASHFNKSILQAPHLGSRMWTFPLSPLSLHNPSVWLDPLQSRMSSGSVSGPLQWCPDMVTLKQSPCVSLLSQPPEAWTALTAQNKSVHLWVCERRGWDGTLPLCSLLLG